MVVKLFCVGNRMIINKLLYSIAILSMLILGIDGFSQQYSESNDFSYALKLYNEGFYDISAKQFSLFVNNYSISDRLPDAKYYLAEALYKLSDFENSRIEFQSLAVAFPDHERAPIAWKMVGEIYEKQNKFEDAATAYQTVKVLYPSHPLAAPSLLKAAEVLLRIKLYSQSERAVHEFLDRYVESPEYPEGRLIFGKLLTEKEEYKLAIKEFKNVIAISKDEYLKSEANYGIAQVYKRLGLLNEAEKYYLNVIKSNAKTESAFNSIMSLSKIYQNRGEWDNSINLIEKYKNNFKSNDAQYQFSIILAQSKFLKQDYFGSRKILEKLNSGVTNPIREALIRFYIAVCYQEEGKIEKAIQEYEVILSKTSKDTLIDNIKPAILQNLTQLFLSKENLQKAAQYVYQFNKDFPNYPAAEQLHFQLVTTAFKLNKLTYASDELKKFSVSFPPSNLLDDLIYIAGISYFQNGKFPESRNLLNRIKENYYCMSKYDSVHTRLSFIETFYPPDKNLGVSELVGLMAKLLADEDRDELLLELGKIYLNELKDFKGAEEIFKKCISQANDSSYTGRALDYLSESQLHQAQFKSFPDYPNQSDFPEVTENLKKAMEYIKFSPRQDSLMFRFLTWSLPSSGDATEKSIEFFRHFESSFPESHLLPDVWLRIANLYTLAKNNDFAVNYYNKVISHSNNEYLIGLAYWEKAILIEEKGDLSNAILSLKDFLLNHHKHPYQAKAYWKLSEYYNQKSDYLTAARFLEKLIELFSYTDFAEQALSKIADYYILGDEYIKALDYVESQIGNIPYFNDPITKYYMGVPKSELYFYAGKAYFRLDEYQNARNQLIQYLSISNQRKYRNEALLLMGEISYQQGNSESALMHLSLVSKDNEPSVFYKANKISADILFNIGEYPAARKNYDILISNSKDTDEKIFFESQKLRCLINEGKIKVFNSELASFKQTFKNHPQKNNYLASFEYELGKYAYLKQNYDRSISRFSKILKSYKNTEYADNALYYQGLCYTTLNKVDDALKKFNKFLKDYPSSPLLGDVYNSIGNIYLRGEKTDLAMESFRKSVQTASNPESKAAAMSNLIKLYKNLGMWDSALRLTREYVQEFPEADDIIDKKILLGICLSNMNRYIDAVDYLKKTKFEASSEQEPEIQFYIGEAYFNAGQYENAIGEFVKIPLLSKKTKLQWEASALYYSGQAYEKMGRTDDAIRMYQEIMDRPGILIELKREAKNRIASLTN